MHNSNNLQYISHANYWDFKPSAAYPTCFKRFLLLVQHTTPFDFLISVKRATFMPRSSQYAWIMLGRAGYRIHMPWSNPFIAFLIWLPRSKFDRGYPIQYVKHNEKCVHSRFIHAEENRWRKPAQSQCSLEILHMTQTFYKHSSIAPSELPPEGF